MKKPNLGLVAVKIDRESVNALLQSLNQIAAIDPENHIAQSAQKLMQKNHQARTHLPARRHETCVDLFLRQRSIDAHSACEYVSLCGAGEH